MRKLKQKMPKRNKGDSGLAQNSTQVTDNGFEANQGVDGDKLNIRKITKADIGKPTDFRHVWHVGWDSNKGFDLTDAPKMDDLKTYIDKAGVSDPETQQLTRDFAEMYDDLNAAKDDVEDHKPKKAPARRRRKAPLPPPSTTGPSSSTNATTTPVSRLSPILTTTTMTVPPEASARSLPSTTAAQPPEANDTSNTMYTQGATTTSLPSTASTMTPFIATNIPVLSTTSSEAPPVSTMIPVQSTTISVTPIAATLNPSPSITNAVAPPLVTVNPMLASSTHETAPSNTNTGSPLVSNIEPNESPLRPNESVVTPSMFTPNLTLMTTDTGTPVATVSPSPSVTNTLTSQAPTLTPTPSTTKAASSFNDSLNSTPPTTSSTTDLVTNLSPTPFPASVDPNPIHEPPTTALMTNHDTAFTSIPSATSTPLSAPTVTSGPSATSAVTPLVVTLIPAPPIASGTFASSVPPLDSVPSMASGLPTVIHTSVPSTTSAPSTAEEPPTTNVPPLNGVPPTGAIESAVASALFPSGGPPTTSAPSTAGVTPSTSITPSTSSLSIINTPTASASTIASASTTTTASSPMIMYNTVSSTNNAKKPPIPTQRLVPLSPVNAVKLVAYPVVTLIPTPSSANAVTTSATSFPFTSINTVSPPVPTLRSAPCPPICTVKPAIPTPGPTMPVPPSGFIPRVSPTLLANAIKSPVSMLRPSPPPLPPPLVLHTPKPQPRRVPLSPSPLYQNNDPNLSKAKDELYKLVFDGEYDVAVEMTKSSDKTVLYVLISETVQKLVDSHTTAKAKLMSFAYKLWFSGAKDVVQKHFPVPFKFVLDQGEVKIVNKGYRQALKLDSRISNNDRLAWGDARDKSSKRVSWQLVPVWENNEVTFKLHNVDCNMFLKLGAEVDVGDRAAWGSPNADTDSHRYYLEPHDEYGDLVFFIINYEYGQGLKLDVAPDDKGDRALVGHDGDIYRDEARFRWIISAW